MEEKASRLETKVKDVHSLTSVLTLDVVSKREDSSIYLVDIGKSCLLVARFHSKALVWLTQNVYFSSGGLDVTNHATQNLGMKLQKQRKRPIKGKEHLQLEDVRKAHFYCVHNGEELATGV